MSDGQGIWSAHAAQWSAVGQPQRPSPEDVALMFSQAQPFFGRADEAGSATACVLGLTPELVQGPWPADSILTAFDRNPDMIDQLWAPHPRCPSRVHRAEWHDLPVEAASFQVVMGDGAPNQCPDAAYYVRFLAEVRRVLRPDGAFIARYFLRPDTPHSLEQIAEAVNAGRIQRFGTLKWQLAMALTSAETMAVVLRDIACAFDALFPDRAALCARTGWSIAEVETIEKYRGKGERYSFPTLAEIKVLASPWFDIAYITCGSYERADCCPILTLTPRVEN